MNLEINSSILGQLESACVHKLVSVSKKARQTQEKDNFLRFFNNFEINLKFPSNH